MNLQTGIFEVDTWHCRVESERDYMLIKAHVPAKYRNDLDLSRINGGRKPQDDRFPEQPIHRFVEGERAPFLFITGPLQAGKTRLAVAIAADLKTAGRIDGVIKFVTPSALGAEAAAIPLGEIRQHRAQATTAGILILDDFFLRPDGKIERDGAEDAIRGIVQSRWDSERATIITASVGVKNPLPGHNHSLRSLAPWLYERAIQGWIVGLERTG